MGCTKGSSSRGYFCCSIMVYAMYVHKILVDVTSATPVSTAVLMSVAQRGANGMDSVIPRAPF